MLNDLWLLISGLILLIGLLTSQGLLLVVGSLVVIVWLLTRVWNRYAFRGVSHSRSLSRHKAFVGESLEYTITLANDKLLPLIWVEIQDTFPDGLELPGASLRGTGVEVSKQHGITTSLLPYQRVSWKYTLKCNSRGYYRIGPARIHSGDIFGFTSGEIISPDVEQVLVYPRIVDLRQLILPVEHPLGEARGSLPLHQDPSRFTGLRDYHPTDPMKHIDWKGTARRSLLQTKIFEPEAALHLLIALNATTGEHAWQGSNRRLFERAVTAAASVAKYADDWRYTFGLVSNAMAVYSGRWLTVPFSRSPAQLGLVLEALAMAGPYSINPLGDALRGAEESLPSGATVALVTAVMTPALAQDIYYTTSRGFRVVVLYAGDGAPQEQVPNVPVHHVGRALARMEEHEPVLA